jgi:two-component system sensor histidine kinase YesM
MKSIQNKIYYSVMLISIIPIVLLGFFAYYISTDSMQKKVNENFLNIMLETDSRLSQKMNQNEMKIKNILQDKELIENYKLYDAGKRREEKNKYHNKLDNIFEKNKESNIKGVVIFFKNGLTYSNCIPETQLNYISYITMYGKPENEEISWFGMKDMNLDGNMMPIFLVGAEIKQPEYICTIYILLDGQQMNDAMGVLEQGLNSSIYDKSGKLMMTNNDKYAMQLWQFPINTSIKVYEGDSGFTKDTFMNEEIMVIYNKSNFKSWYIVVIVPYSYYTNEVRYIGYLTIVLIIIVFAFIHFFLYYFLKRILKPLKRLTYAMQEVGKSNFDIYVKEKTNDEIEIICNSYNNMIDKIKELFNSIKMQESKKREMEILALRYQINPHFLYNTLTAIRFMALDNNQTKIAESLKYLSKFLQNILNRKNEFISIEEEFRTISDYIDVMQVRYNNNINVEYYIEEDLENEIIPGMIIQPIVENAIQHGISDKIETEEGLLQLRAYRENKYIIIEVIDNGIGIDDDKINSILNSPSRSMGIKNISHRIQQYYGEKCKLEIISGKDNGTTVKISIVHSC